MSINKNNKDPIYAQSNTKPKIITIKFDLDTGDTIFIAETDINAIIKQDFIVDFMTWISEWENNYTKPIPKGTYIFDWKEKCYVKR